MDDFQMDDDLMAVMAKVMGGGQEQQLEDVVFQMRVWAFGQLAGMSPRRIQTLFNQLNDDSDDSPLSKDDFYRTALAVYAIYGGRDLEDIPDVVGETPEEDEGEITWALEQLQLQEDAGVSAAEAVSNIGHDAAVRRGEHECVEHIPDVLKKADSVGEVDFDALLNEAHQNESPNEEEPVS